MERKLTHLFQDEVQKPFSELPTDLQPGQFSCASGGRGLSSGYWSISIMNGDITEIYVLPDYISHLINEAEICGKHSAQQDMRAALGL